MPALSTVTFTSTHADSYEPVAQGNGIWNLIVPDSAEACVADVSTVVDLHLNVTIPTGFTGIITGHGAAITGATNCSIATQLLRGTGSPVAVKLNVHNPTGSNETPTANNVFAKLIVIKETHKFKHVQAGTWA